MARDWTTAAGETTAASYPKSSIERGKVQGSSTGRDNLTKKKGKEAGHGSRRGGLSMRGGGNVSEWEKESVSADLAGEMGEKEGGEMSVALGRRSSRVRREGKKNAGEKTQEHRKLGPGER